MKYMIQYLGIGGKREKISLIKVVEVIITFRSSILSPAESSKEFKGVWSWLFHFLSNALVRPADVFLVTRGRLSTVTSPVKTKCLG